MQSDANKHALVEAAHALRRNIAVPEVAILVMGFAGYIPVRLTQPSRSATGRAAHGARTILRAYSRSASRWHGDNPRTHDPRMNAVLFISFSSLVRFACRSFLSALALPFLDLAPRRTRRGIMAGCGTVRDRLHASFLLAMAVAIACLLAPLGVAGSPLFNPKHAQFVYLQESAGGEQQLRLGTFDAIAPKPRAHHIATLEDVDGNFQTIYGTSVRNDNHYVAVYVFEDGSVIEASFLDHNLKIYAMQTGAGAGMVNEHSFSGLNRVTLPSARLNEFLAERIAMGELDEETAALFDYYVDVDAGTLLPPAYRWNQDKTLSVTFTLPVMAYLGSASEAGYIGDETFTRTYAVGASLEFLGWSLHAPAMGGNFFILGPVNADVPQAITFQKKVVTFHYPGFPGFWEGPRYAVRVDGKIPRTVMGVISAP